MPYYTGTANDWDALPGALRTACTGNGWTLSGDVLHKGNAYVKAWIGTWAEVKTLMGIPGTLYHGATESLYITAGLGIDGSNELADRAHYCGRIGGQSPNRLDGSFVTIPFTFPVEYQIHVHASPDEVFLVVRHDSDFYQHLSFGHNPVAQATGGSGCWASASFAPQVFDTTGVGVETGFRVGPQYQGVSPASNGSAAAQNPGPPCWNGNNGGNVQIDDWFGSNFEQLGVHTACHTIHHGADGAKWSGGPEWQASVSLAANPKFIRGISEVDGSAPLIRPIAIVPRPDNKGSVVAQFEHYRLLRIDHLPVETLYELGADTWKVYPFMRRSPDGSFPLGPGWGSGTSRIMHSGYLGWAVRYDGA